MNQTIEIKSRLPATTLPEKWGLVLEGGGTRGSYTAGVLDTFLQAGMMFPYTVGVSAGAANGLSYVSGQQGRNRAILEHHIPNPSYMGMTQYARNGSFINRDYAFRALPDQYLPFDWDSFHSNQANLISGAFDCNSGEMAWHDKNKHEPDMKTIMATTAIPFVSPMVEIEGQQLLDGGISCPIPIEKSIADGNEFHVVVLTRSYGYRKNRSNPSVIKKFYGENSPISRALLERHDRYNAELDLCLALEREGRAIILRPRNEIEVGRLDRNRQRLLKLFHEGEYEAQKVVTMLNWLLEGKNCCTICDLPFQKAI